jgi:hypothetical protein
MIVINKIQNEKAYFSSNNDCHFTTLAFSQNLRKTTRGTNKDTAPSHKFSLSTTYLTFANFGPEQINVHMYEFHFGI